MSLGSPESGGGSWRPSPGLGWAARVMGSLSPGRRMSHSDSLALGHLFLCPGRVGVIVSETLPIVGTTRSPQPRLGLHPQLPHPPLLPSLSPSSSCASPSLFLSPVPWRPGSSFVSPGWCCSGSLWVSVSLSLPSLCVCPCLSSCRSLTLSFCISLSLSLSPVSHLWVPILTVLGLPELHFRDPWRQLDLARASTPCVGRLRPTVPHRAEV